MKREFESLSLQAAQALMREVLEAGHRFRFTAHGTSMSPFIRDGDSVELMPVTQPRYGEVLAVSDGARLMLHRVVKMKGDAVLLKGDHARNADGWFEKGQILGKVASVRHQNREQPIGVNRLCRTVARLSQWNWLPAILKIRAVLSKK